MVKNTLKGFTLAEIVLTLGIFMGATILLLPTSINQINQTEVETEVIDLTTALFRQQQNSLAGIDNKVYGITFNANSYESFFGDTPAAKEGIDTSILENGVTITNINLADLGNEIYFDVNSFRPSTTGSVTISNGVKTFQISINDEGFIERTRI